MTVRPLEIVLGPLLFNWPAERVVDLYARIADEAPVDRVYLGEVVCGKREPLLQHTLADAAERLEKAGKVVVWSTLALPMTARDRRGVAETAADPDRLVEINDAAALWSRSVGSFVAGPMLNIYNEAAARELMARGCTRLCANVELSLPAISTLAKGCPGLEIELFAFGRLPLALSGRCYHARTHGLHRDSCRYVCDRDPDGLAVRTLGGQDFLAVNGVQTLSHAYQVADIAPSDLQAAGVTALRLSPHTADMVAVAKAFRAFADGLHGKSDLLASLVGAGVPTPLAGGYLRGEAGVTGLVR
ncbi:MAG: U32 family peptidase [Caulobacteraceae bacterium]|nr:U32 family peptidase [Caulobacteraceae bacterium]